MKKLGKKMNSTRESVQAYSCSSCSCYCDGPYGGTSNAVNSLHYSNVSVGY